MHKKEKILGKHTSILDNKQCIYNKFHSKVVQGQLPCQGIVNNMLIKYQHRNKIALEAPVMLPEHVVFI